MIWITLLLTMLLVPVTMFAFIFDSSGPVDTNAAFKKNDCFKTSSDVTTWLIKQTSGASYKRFNRPGLNESLEYNAPLKVNVSVDMNSMASVDEMNSEYKIILKMDLEWIDDRLAYNCSPTPVAALLDSYYFDRIWSPKLGVPNIRDPDTSIIQGEATLIFGQIRTDGYVHIRLNLLLNLFCYLDFALFPFDKQECYIKLESRSYARNDLILVWRHDHPFRNFENFLMTGFNLIGYELFNDTTSTQTGSIEDIYGLDTMSRLMVKLEIQREWNNYFLEIYLPSILFVMISWLSFWMQITSAPARVSLGMTTMLTLVTSSQMTRDKLPRIGYIHALDVWIAFCSCFIFISLIEFAHVSYIHRSAVDRKAKQDESVQTNFKPTSKQQQPQRQGKHSPHRKVISSNSPMFTILRESKRSNIRRQSSDTTDYSVSNGQNDNNSKFIQLMNTINNHHISVALPSMRVVDRDRYSHPDYHRYLEPHNDDYERQARLVEDSMIGKRKPRRHFCCMFWCATNCEGDRLADAIDRYCRIIFPVSFIVFNIVYWWFYLAHQKKYIAIISDKDK